MADRSRAPKSVAGRAVDDVVRLIVSERRRHPTWGPKKIRRILETKHGIEEVSGGEHGRRGSHQARDWKRCHGCAPSHKKPHYFIPMNSTSSVDPRISSIAIVVW